MEKTEGGREKGREGGMYWILEARGDSIVWGNWRGRLLRITHVGMLSIIT